MVEVTTRTVQARHLLRPSKKANELILGVIGRALALYPGTKMFGYWFMSNHYHMLLWVPDAHTLSMFMTHLNGNLAKEIGALHGWRQKFWGRRYRAIVVCDAKSMVARLVYLLSQGSKEGLVAKPGDWPGVTCVRAMLEGTPDVGRWFDRSERNRREHAGERLGPGDCSTVYRVPLAPLPCWKSKSKGWCRRRVRALLSEIVEETSERNCAIGREPLGATAALARSPSYRPPKFAAKPAPLCHAASDESRSRFLRRYYRFLDRCRRATTALRNGGDRRAVRFPKGAFVPRLPLLTHAGLAAA